MASDREMLEAQSLNRLADDMQGGPGARPFHVANAELQRRLAVWQRETHDAHISTASAAQETARYTKSAARWMFWSVMAIAITSSVQALFAFLAWYAPRK
jgi:hypothetical protein